MPPSTWFESAFRADYCQVYAHRDSAAAEAEVHFLCRSGLPGRGARVLDLACGHGRHSLALARAGLRPLGLDLSPDLLGCAPSELHGRLVRGDMRALPFAQASLDACVCLFSSFGYFAAEGEHSGVLRALRRVLRPRAPLFLDLMNPARIRERLVPESVTERDGMRILERRKLADGGRRVQKQVHIELADGSSRSWTEDVRLFEPEEIEALLNATGFVLEATWGDFGGQSFDLDSDRQLLRARRAVSDSNHL